MEKLRSTVYVSRETWYRFKELTVRDRTSMSEKIEEFIEEWLKLHEPGNPQRPITAFVKGHPDEEAAARTELLNNLFNYADRRDMKVNHRVVTNVIKKNTLEGKGRLGIIKEMEADLKKLGVTILY